VPTPILYYSLRMSGCTSGRPNLKLHVKSLIAANSKSRSVVHQCPKARIGCSSGTPDLLPMDCRELDFQGSISQDSFGLRYLQKHPLWLGGLLVPYSYAFPPAIGNINCPMRSARWVERLCPVQVVKRCIDCTIKAQAYSRCDVPMGDISSRKV